MLKTRAQGEEIMFKWARTEVKRELVMSQSTYAKIAGIQSEIGRVVITRIAGSEVEYKRLLNMYRKDVTCSVNNIRREQVKMRRQLGRYARKLKQTRIEHTKLIKDQQKRDNERALLEQLHLRLKFETASKTPEPSEKPFGFLEVNVHLSEQEPVSPTELDFNGGPVFLETGHVCKSEGYSRETSSEIQISKHATKQSRVFSPLLPMINEEVEKEAEILNDDEKLNENNSDQMVPDKFTLKIWDEDMSVSSYGGRIKKKNDVSFSDIIKLKYSGTKNLFDLVHRLARKHGIPDVVEKVPDPRDSVVLRGSTNDSYRLQAAVLYPMKYGYSEDKQDMTPLTHIKSPSLSKSPLIVACERDIMAQDYHENEEKPKRLRKLSFENKRTIILSGVHSKSLDEDVESISLPDIPNSNRKLKSEHLSLAELAEKVAKLKFRKAERLTNQLETEAIRSNSRLPSPTKPSSSRSSKSLPALPKTNDSSQNNVSWTHAFGLLKGVHSLDDVYVA